MKRTLVTKKDLLNWMNSQLAKHEECTDCRFDAVKLLEEEDEYGCNWYEANLNCSGVPTRVCEPIAQRIVAQAKEQFNVK